MGKVLRIRYPVLTLEHQEVLVSEETIEKLKNMGSAERGRWAWNTLFEMDLPSWKSPARVEDVESAFDVGAGFIDGIEA